MVKGWGNLDDLDAKIYQKLVGDAPHRHFQRSWRDVQPPVPGCQSRAHGRVANVDVDREEHSIALVQGDLEGLGETRALARDVDLRSLRPHALVGHPVHILRTRSSPQSDLEEAIAPHGTTLDQATHRRPMGDERAEVDVASVRRDHGHSTMADVLRHASSVRPGDGDLHQHQRDGERDHVSSVDGRLQIGDGACCSENISTSPAS